MSAKHMSPKQAGFEAVLNNIDVGVDMSEGDYWTLQYYLAEYINLHAEVKRLRGLVTELRGILADEEIAAYIHEKEIARAELGVA